MWRAYSSFAREIAKRLKAFGIEFVLELWNEPHNFVIRPKLGGDWVGNPPSPWWTDMLRWFIAQFRR